MSNVQDLENRLTRVENGEFQAATYDEAVTFESTIHVDGASHLEGAVTTDGAVTVGTTLEVTGATTLSAGVTAVGGAGTAAGAGLLSTGAGAPTVKVLNLGGEIITIIKCDLTGLGSKSDENDVIGLTAGGAAYLTRVTTAVNGLIHKVEMFCSELPTASANPALDIDLMSNSSGTAAYDTDGAAYTAIITAGGNWAAQGYKVNTSGAFPAADDYLYLCDGATHTGASVFTGGQFVIKLYGYALLA